jgi:predicted methyltransferase MtxX (methanogen marker protein 4)
MFSYGIERSKKVDGKMRKRFMTVYKDRRKMMKRCRKVSLIYSRIDQVRWKDAGKILSDNLRSTKVDGKMMKRSTALF